MGALTPREEHRRRIKRERAEAMRNMSEADRDAAIDATPNVIDLRATLDFRRRQRELASGYRKPTGGGHA